MIHTTLTASELMIWGLVLHLVADWPLQNDWMARNKAKRWVDKDGDGVLRNRRMQPYAPWWLRHPAAWIHAGIHTLLLAAIFGWAALALGFVHLIIDTRWPVAGWSKFIGQTQPENRYHLHPHSRNIEDATLIYDVGLEVRFWTDQVFHIVCIAVAALLIA